MEDENSGRISFDQTAGDIVIRDLIERVDAGEKPLVPGYVYEIGENNYGFAALYNNAYVLGSIGKYSWRRGHVRLFPEACKIDNVYDFHIVGYWVPPETGKIIFHLSREDLEKSWQDVIDENDIEVGRELTVRCVYIPDPTFKRKYCFGAVSDDIKGLEMFVYVPESKAEGIKVGEKYRCKIAEIDNKFSLVYATLETEKKTKTSDLFKFPWED